MTTKLIAASLAVAALALIATPSDARPRQTAVTQFCGDRYCATGTEGVRSREGRPRRAGASRRLAGASKAAASYRRADAARSTALPRAKPELSRREAKVMPHPPGCPTRAFCGCGTSLYLLGKAVRAGGLAIARNWLAFPRAACAPRMAAARPGHVFAIIECLPGNRALVYDPNSGRHQTRIHVRDLGRYAIVNPHGRNRYAEAR